MPRVHLLVILLVATAKAGAFEPTEEEAYTMLTRTREQAIRAGTPEVVAGPARRFLADHPGSGHAPRVRLWLGDALAATQPREAYAAYRASTDPEAAARAERLAILHEAPPEIEAEHWVGRPIDPREPGGKVTMLAFVSLTHPQATRALPHLIKLQEELESRGLRLAAVATVIDDHANQKPDALRRRIVALDLPLPVAIDRQRANRPSVTFDKYLGMSLPWVVLLDRYGRVAWMGGLSPTADATTGLRARVEALLDEPTYEKLVEGVVAGDAKALDRLATIRTKQTVSCLLEVLGGEPEPALRRRVQRALRGIAPAHYSVDPNGRARWDMDKGGYRYSLAEDRLVKK